MRDTLADGRVVGDEGIDDELQVASDSLPPPLSYLEGVSSVLNLKQWLVNNTRSHEVSVEGSRCEGENTFE